MQDEWYGGWVIWRMSDMEDEWYAGWVICRMSDMPWSVNMNFTSTNMIVLPDVIPFQTTLLFQRYVCCSNYVCINAFISIKQEAGVKGSLTNIEEFSLSLIPFDYDLLSMEMDNSFNVSISSNHICIYSFSSSGKTVNKETNFGKIYHIGLTC